MSFPSFSTGEVLTAADMNAVGLWLVKTETIGNGVSSVTVTGAFNADFRNYRIVINGGTQSANGSMRMQLNNATGSTYQMMGYFGTFGSATLSGYGPAATTQWTDIGIGSTTGYGIVCDLWNPQAAAVTYGTTWSVSAGGVYHFGMRETTSSQHTGFTFGPLAGGATLTGGTIRVYGYRN